MVLIWGEGCEAGIYTQIVIPRQHCVMRVEHCAKYFDAILEGIGYALTYSQLL